MDIFQTDRLQVRELKMSDIHALNLLFIDPEVQKFYPGINSKRRIKQWLDESLLMYKKYGHGMWAVTLKDSTEIIGQAGIVFQMIDNRYEYEVGCIVRNKYTHCGYAIEVLNGCMRVAFEYMKLHKIIGLIEDHNHLSIKLAESVGMRFNKRIIKWGKKYCLYETYNPNYA